MDDEHVEFPLVPGLHQSIDENAPPIVDDDGSDSYVDEPPPDENEPEPDQRPVPVNGGEASAPVFATLDEWVEKYLLNLYRRSVEGHEMTWCREWWRHPEAYLRLDALWRAWEFLRKQPATGMAVWIRDYADQHMSVLLSESGPFKGCEPTRHSPYELRPLPTLAPPNWETLTQAYEALRSREWEDDGQ